MAILFYAGIGSRQTPPDILAQMTRYAKRLQELGWVLRSGGAHGADTAFEHGAGDMKEIFLPWPNFNTPGKPRPVTQTVHASSPSQDAMRMAAKVHPTSKASPKASSPSSRAWKPAPPSASATARADPVYSVTFAAAWSCTSTSSMPNSACSMSGWSPGFP
jgi:hypothetical protein